MLKSVSATALSRAGICLRAPAKPATVSQDAAQQAALRAMPGTAIRETVLADFSDTHHVPAIRALAWVISLTGASGFRPHRAGPARGGVVVQPEYLVVFIDAGTGEFIMATKAGRLQGQARPAPLPEPSARPGARPPG